MQTLIEWAILIGIVFGCVKGCEHLTQKEVDVPGVEVKLDRDGFSITRENEFQRNLRKGLEQLEAEYVADSIRAAQENTK